MLTELNTMIYIIILVFIMMLSLITIGCIVLLSTSIKTIMYNNTIVRVWNKMIK